MSGTSSGSIPRPPTSHRWASQALEDFWRAVRSDLNVASIRSTPSQIDTTPVSPIPGPSPHIPLNETLDRVSPSSLGGSDDGINGRRRSKSRFSLSAISDAIIDSMRSHPALTTKRNVEETSMRSGVHDGGWGGESSRGRSRERGKGKNLSHALIKVSEVFGSEPEEGESRGCWKEFKRGVLLSDVIPGCPVPHAITVR